MTRRFVDISVPLQADIASDPPGFEPAIEYLDHKQTAPDVCRFFPGLTPADLPGGEGWAIERLRIVTHNGTHLDAPYHFHSTMNRGERASLWAFIYLYIATRGSGIWSLDGMLKKN